MCGIVGYIGSKNVTEILMDGLTRLEYRGYDSAGVAVLENGKINVVKAQGRLQALREKLEKHPLTGHVGIGHTRWATHGEPSDEKHATRIFPSRKKSPWCITASSKTMRPCASGWRIRAIILSARPIPRFLRSCLKRRWAAITIFSPLCAPRWRRSRAPMAWACVCSRFPDRIIAARKDSPLIVGLGEDGNYIASDIPAIMPYTRRVYLLEEGEMAQVFADHVEIYDMDGERVEKEVYEVTWSVDAAERGGYPHFMLKEIYDQGRAMRDTISPRVKSRPL